MVLTNRMASEKIFDERFRLTSFAQFGHLPGAVLHHLRLTSNLLPYNRSLHGHLPLELGQIERVQVQLRVEQVDHRHLLVVLRKAVVVQQPVQLFAAVLLAPFLDLAQVAVLMAKFVREIVFAIEPDAATDRVLQRVTEHVTNDVPMAGRQERIGLNFLGHPGQRQ